MKNNRSPYTPEDFSRYLEKWEDQLLAKALVAKKILAPEVTEQAWREFSQLSCQQRGKFGQFLIRKRILPIQHYTQIMVLVKQKAWELYQRQQQKESSGEIKVTSDVYQASRAPQQQSLPPGTRIGSYEILEEIARGGMGVVYKAKQLYLNRVVALKFLRSAGVASAKEIERFKREAEAAGVLQHPNIVSIYEIDEQDGFHYFTMDYVEGETLDKLIKKKVRRKKLLGYLIKIARALDHTHQRGIVHRDIKPSNIIVSSSGDPKITDFGLAKKLDSESMLTESGSTMGTPYYMSPEQTKGGKDIDGRSDIYSLGVILYEILTQRLPFRAATLVELYHKIVEEEPLAPNHISRIKVERDLETICLKCIEKDPQLRYQNAEELAQDLERYLNGEAILARRASSFPKLWRKVQRKWHLLAIWAGGIFLVLALGLFFFLRSIQDDSSLSEQERQSLIVAQTMLEEARKLRKNNSIDKALLKFEKAIEAYPLLREAYLEKGDVYRGYKDYQRAIKEYQRLLEKDPDYAPAHLHKGYAYMGLEKWTKAIEEFTLAIEHDPDYYKAYEARGEAYKKRGQARLDPADFEKSIQDHTKAARLEKKMTKGH